MAPLPSSRAPAERVRAHLEGGCRACADAVAYWQRCLTAMQADRGPAPSAAVLQRAFALFDRFSPSPTMWEKLVAVLSFDTRLAGPAMAAARDAGLARPPGLPDAASEPTAFQLFYRAGSTEIDLLCEQGAVGHSQNWQITGQAVRHDQQDHLGLPIPWRVAIRSPGVAPAEGVRGKGSRAAETDVDSLGIFRLTGLEPGTYDLVLRGASREILLPGIRLG